jgi:hypothetical protein
MFESEESKEHVMGMSAAEIQTLNTECWFRYRRPLLFTVTDSDVLVKCLDAGLDINETSRFLFGSTPVLMFAKLANSIVTSQNMTTVYSSMIRILVNRGADLSRVDDRGRTILFFCNDLDIMEKVMVSLPIDMTDFDGNNPVTYRLLSPEFDTPIEILEWFLQHGVDINYQNNAGECFATCVRDMQGNDKYQQLIELGHRYGCDFTLEKCSEIGFNQQ